MNTEIETDDCPHCKNQVIIPNGWITFRNDRIVSIDADWRCPECNETGKTDIGGVTNKHWEPRDIVTDQDVPETPRPGDLERDTPERRAVEFLDYWKQDDYRSMGKFIPPSEGIKDRHAPVVMKDFYKDYELKHYVLQEVKDESPIMTIVSVEIEIIRDGSVETKHREIEMIREVDEGSGDPDGMWYIAQWPTLGSGYRYRG